MNTPHRKALGSALALSLILFAAHVSAQSPPTATEAFNLRRQCKKMSDEKAQEALDTNTMLKWEIVAAWNTSRYDPTSNRCYGRSYQHIVKPSYRLDHENDQVFDLQTDDLLAAAMIENGKSMGISSILITGSRGFHRVVQRVAHQILAIKRGKPPRTT